MKTEFPFASAIALALLMAASNGNGETEGAHKGERPNVLFIAVDDLNDWIGVLGGHPQAKTPHMDELASRGVLFSNAHCQSPVCNPSRASLMTSLYPSTSGIYFLSPDIKESPVASKSIVIPRRFEKEGYHVFAAGKLFHNARGINEYHVPNYAGQFGGVGPLPKKKISRFPGMRLWDWGVYPARDDQMPDHKIASWAEERLAETDVLIWRAHAAHGDVDDAIVERVANHVNAGMGLILLHSAHFAKIFKRLMGRP